MSKNVLEKCLVLSLVCGVIIGTFYPINQRNIDINEDGIIDVCDVQQLISAIISNNISNLPDINNDGKIDIQDLQILMKNMGEKQKTGKLKIEMYSSIPRTSYNDQQIKNLGTYTIVKKFNLISECNKFTICSKRCIRKVGDKENINLLKLYGEKYLAYHISAQSPPRA